jgi:SAM-dependent methyltransferase
MQSHARGGAALLEANRRFYDPLWTDVGLVEPRRFNTWPLVCSLVSPSQPRLEVAPGLRPRLPLDETHFVDVSPAAVAKLRARGANAVVALVSALPFPDRAFALVGAFDIVEHVDDEDAILSELSRVAAPDASLLLSVPLHPGHWTAFDDFVGHRRRYEPQRLIAKLAEHGFSVEQSAVYGMRPRSSRLVGVGMWFLTHRREQAMRWYNRVFMPLAMRFQKKLALAPGLLDTERIDEVLLVCRKDAAVSEGRRTRARR